jgi:prevent-host-death family protein
VIRDAASRLREQKRLGIPAAGRKIGHPGCGEKRDPKKLPSIAYVRYTVRMTKFMTTTQARKVFYDVIETAKRPGMPIVITHKGIPEVVVMSFEEFEGWQETMEIMADPELSRGLIRDLKQLKAKKLKTVDYNTFRKSLKL